MVYVNDYVRINILGDAYGQTEIWNTGFNIIHSSTPNISLGTLEGYAEAVAGLWNTAFSITGQGSFSNSHRTTAVKASLIGVDGRVKDDLVAEFFYDSPIVGKSAAAQPAQIATVVTFRSDVRKGPAALGRMYLPPVAQTISGANGLWNETPINERLSTMLTFFRGVNNVAVGEGGLGLTSPVGEGRQSLVTRIGVDRKPDTQRRRANSLIADLTFTDLYEEEG